MRIGIALAAQLLLSTHLTGCQSNVVLFEASTDGSIDGGVDSGMADATQEAEMLHMTYQYQLSGTVDTTVDAMHFAIDFQEVDAIAALVAMGRTVSCYISIGTHEPWRTDADAFPASALGNSTPDFPDERWLDVRNAGVVTLMRQRIAEAAGNGCQGALLSATDAYNANSGFALTAEDQLQYNRALGQTAKSEGLLVGIVDDFDQLETLVADFDWAMGFHCGIPTPCDSLSAFTQAGKPALLVQDFSAERATTCSFAAERGFDVIFKNSDVTARRETCEDP